VILFGFAAAKAVRKSFLTILMCLCVFFYEFAFVYYGSSQNENILKNTLYEQKLTADENLKILETEMKMSRRKYEAKLSQYEDPLSKVYENNWFRKVHLQSALNSWKKSTGAFNTRKSSITSTLDKGNDILNLKIAYRLLLVLFCMIASHFFVKELINFCQKHRWAFKV
jgi:hypothetical protein